MMHCWQCVCVGHLWSAAVGIRTSFNLQQRAHKSKNHNINGGYQISVNFHIYFEAFLINYPHRNATRLATKSWADWCHCDIPMTFVWILLLPYADSDARAPDETLSKNHEKLASIVQITAIWALRCVRIQSPKIVGLCRFHIGQFPADSTICDYS